MYRSVQREGEKYIKVALSYLVVELLSDHHLFCRANFLNLITQRKKNVVFPFRLLHKVKLK